VSGEEEYAAETPPESEQAEGTATAVAPEKKPTPAKPELLPPFRVLLHNDDVNEFEHVIRSVVKLTPLSLEEAVERTLEAHTTGVALLLVTHQERAELYCEQFATFKLTVTCEPEG
jgi:ATP-dependent Clp protease adaptor protein ClpS